MKAFKFRGSEQVEMTLDILLNKRLYCADWRRLNDPMEGIFAYSSCGSGKRDRHEDASSIIDHAGRLKVCSLSKTFDNHLLWAHYASGFSGVAIEVDLPDSCQAMKEVVYGGVFGYVAFDEESEVDPRLTAERVLSRKYEAWSYEQEIRILQADQWFNLENPICRIIVGHRASPALVRTLAIVCKELGVELYRTGIGDEGIDADWIDMSDLINP